MALTVVEKYMKEMVKSIMKLDPSLDKDTVSSIVKSVIKEKLRDPSIIMDNNVTGKNFRTTLTGLCDYIDNRQPRVPVVSGNATFYCQPEELESPTSMMLRDLKIGRKKVKKLMYKYNPRSSEYELLDLDQQNKKVIMNAEYGGSGTPTAAFYTKYSPAATTLMAQSIITTMAAFFEGFVGDNQKFFHINECFDWMNKVVKKDDKIPKWIIRPRVEDVVRRISSHFYSFDVNDYPIIRAYIEHCNEDELTYLYYANNMKEFISRHPRVSGLISSVLDTLPRYEASIDKLPAEFEGKFEDDEINSAVDKYNKWISKEMFLDPYSIPDCIKEYMDELKSLFTQFVYVEYITPDSIIKLNNHKRNTVLLVDTDSNVINADIFVSFIRNKIFPGQKFRRVSIYNDMILVNVLASILDVNVASLLDYYGRCHNMGKEARAELTMKNEFMFRRFFLMKTKKRYSASIVLREGNIILPFKLEIKGMDFIKAGVSKDVSDRFTKMLEEHVLFSDDIELHELMKDLKSFEREIYNDLRNGGTKYLKQQQYKDESAYKNPWSIQVFKGSIVWNLIYPDNKINSLDRVSLLKTIVVKPENIEKIKDRYPKEYDLVMNKIYSNDSNEIRKTGIKIIAIPNNVKKIPDWLLSLIDTDIIISDVISSFRSVLDALKMEEMEFKTPNGKASITSCLISL